MATLLPTSLPTIEQLRTHFKYGFEYEVLIVSAELTSMYNEWFKNYKNQPKLLSNTSQGDPCDARTVKDIKYFMKNLKEPNEKQKTEDPSDRNHFPYRQALYNILRAHNAPVHAKFSAFQVDTFCPDNTPGAWTIEYDKTVKFDIKDLNPKVPLYSTLDSYMSDEMKDNIVSCFEIISPVMSSEYVEKHFENDLNALTANGEIAFYNNDVTSNHMHLSCVLHGHNIFEDPKVLLTLFRVWLLFEPLILFALPEWRRVNGFTTTMFNLFKYRFSQLGDLRNNSEILFKKLLTLEVNELFKLTHIYPVTRDMSRTHKLERREHGDKEDNHELIKLITIFQGNIGKKDAKMSYKSNSARFAGLNALNLLNPNAETRTIEVRLKHGSSDAKENKAFFKLFTDISIWAIQLAHNTEEAFKLFNNPDLIKCSVAASNAIDNNQPQLVVPPLLKSLNIDEVSKNFLMAQIISMYKLIIEANPSMSSSHLGSGSGSGSGFGTGSGSGSGEPAKRQRTKGGCCGNDDQDGGGKAILSWVFCYGSNGVLQLKDRVDHKGDFVYRPVVLKGWSRIYCGYSGMWDGAVASIHPDPKGRVYGTIVQLNKGEMKKLDRYEAVGIKGWYYRHPVKVEDALNNEKYEAIAYVKEGTTYTHPPSIKYLESISENLHNAGLKKPMLGKGLRVRWLDENKKLRHDGYWTYGAATVKRPSTKK